MDGFWRENLSCSYQPENTLIVCIEKLNTYSMYGMKTPQKGLQVTTFSLLTSQLSSQLSYRCEQKTYPVLARSVFSEK